MNLFGTILFVLAGIIAIRLPQLAKTKKLTNYSNYPIATAKVLHTHDFCGNRWIVEFIDNTGRKVIGMDDVITPSSFSRKYKKPVFGSMEKIYYYPLLNKNSYGINREKVKYYIHFCDEHLYELCEHIKKRDCIVGYIIGIILIMCGLLIFKFA